MIINNNNDNQSNLAFGMISLWNSSNFDDLLQLQKQIDTNNRYDGYLYYSNSVKYAGWINL